MNGGRARPRAHSHGVRCARGNVWNFAFRKNQVQGKDGRRDDETHMLRPSARNKEPLNSLVGRKGSLRQLCGHKVWGAGKCGLEGGSEHPGPARLNTRLSYSIHGVHVYSKQICQCFFPNAFPVWLSGLSIILQSQRSRVQFQVAARAWIAGTRSKSKRPLVEVSLPHIHVSPPLFLPPFPSL